MNNDLVVIDDVIECTIETRDECAFTAGDYVTRDGTDIHFVLEHNDDLVKVVCIVSPSQDWTKPGQVEDNLTRRYSRINRHFLRFARNEHDRLKKIFTDGYVYEY